MHFSAEHWAHHSAALSWCHLLPLSAVLAVLLLRGKGSSPALLPRPIFTPDIPSTSSHLPPCSGLIRRGPLPTAPILQKTSRWALLHCASQQRRAWGLKSESKNSSDMSGEQCTNQEADSFPFLSLKDSEVLLKTLNSLYPPFFPPTFLASTPSLRWSTPIKEAMKSSCENSLLHLSTSITLKSSVHSQLIVQYILTARWRFILFSRSKQTTNEAVTQKPLPSHTAAHS